MNIDDLFADPKKMEDGVWVEFFQDSRLKIASTDSKRYKAALAKLAKQHKLQLDDSNENAIDLVRDITAEAMAHHVLLDWEGISMHGKDNIEYSPKLGKEVLLRSAKVRAFIDEAAADYSTFKAATVAAVKKPSAGS